MNKSGITPEEFSKTTYAERYHAIKREEDMKSGNISFEEACVQAEEASNFRREAALERAYDAGITDPVGIAAVQAEVDQEFAAFAEEAEQATTVKALIVFDRLGPLAHPGKTWTELSIEEQDLYRSTAEEVVLDFYDTEDSLH